VLRGVKFSVSVPGFLGPQGELYFPKPFNAEQIQIIERFEHTDGVVAQGPPGTGKSHTIANVICHYLAEGKRVLVTSKAESALTVLRDHLLLRCGV
jgi:superfamily II DNA or RNA helicase